MRRFPQAFIHVYRTSGKLLIVFEECREYASDEERNLKDVNVL